jgi:acetyl esterase/lipase
MSIEVAKTTERPPRAWLYNFILTLAIILLSLTLLIVTGVLLPGIPLLGALGTICESFLSLHIVLAALVALLLSLAVWRVRRGKVAATVGALSALVALTAVVPLNSLVTAAHREGASISWWQHLHLTAIGPTAMPDETALYATVGGQKLYADIYLPDREVHPSPWPTVFMMHGGGFVRGSRSDGRNWDRWFAQRGYAVFDVDYRLAPPIAWNRAAPDVACAIAWAQSQAESLHINPNRSLIVGQSAGASLALQVAYGLGDGTFSSSCGGSVHQPDAVFALYPAEDFGLLWTDERRLGPLDTRDVDITYIGGPPDQFPDRYRAVSPIAHVRADLPPTFIAYGEQDHLIPTSGHGPLAAKLTEAAVPNVLLAIPYSDHGYDAFWGSIGGQITRHVLGNFLSQHFPAQTGASKGSSPTAKLD